MHDAPFDEMTRSFSQSMSRRVIGRLLGTVAAVSLLGNFSAYADGQDAVAAKNQNRKNHRQKKRKRQNRKKSVCYLDETVRARRKKRKRFLKKGATRGACPTCTSCPAGTVCDGSTCQTCTVTCASDPVTCGTALATALAAGESVYVCPGIYAGNFTVDSVRVVGAGSDSDPASNTILDGQGLDRVLEVNFQAVTYLAGLRITGGNTNLDGGGIATGPQVDLTVIDCAIVDNTATGVGTGGGLYLVGSTLKLRNSQISGNSADLGGGLRIMFSDNVSINNCDITGNTGAGGGGVYTAGSTLAITRSEISSNTSSNEGGGGVFAAQEAVVTFDGASRVTDNKAAAAGGGILNAFDGSVTLNGAKVTGNTPDQCSGVSGC